MLEAITAFEGPFLLWVQAAVRQPWLDPVVAFFTQLGNAGLVWVVLSLVLLCFPRTRRAGFWALVALLFGLLCTNVVLKHMVGRVRPWVTFPALVPVVAEHDPLSFPSGHTCAAFAAGMTWFRCAGKDWLKAVCVGQAVLMGLSRLYVGVHYPSDVLVGCLVGCLCAWLSWRVQKAVEKRRERL